MKTIQECANLVHQQVVCPNLSDCRPESVAQLIATMRAQTEHVCPEQAPCVASSLQLFLRDLDDGEGPDQVHFRFEIGRSGLNLVNAQVKPQGNIVMAVPVNGPEDDAVEAATVLNELEQGVGQVRTN